MTKAPRGFLSDRRGAIAAMTALLATVLIGFGGLAAETAFWYAQKQALQNQADAAALSGAYELLQGNSANAGTWTKNDAVLNGAARSSVNVAPRVAPLPAHRAAVPTRPIPSARSS